MTGKPLLLLASLLSAACASGETRSSDEGETAAAAAMRDAQGRDVGTVRLVEVGDGVRVVAELRDLPPGQHGFHVHGVGACAPTFEAAGEHFNPTGRQHGLLNPEGPHAGDLENVTVDADGRGQLQDVTDRFTLSAGSTSLLDSDGSALILHAQPDDQRTDPSGESGDRVACGVVERA